MTLRSINSYTPPEVIARVLNGEIPPPPEVWVRVKDIMLFCDADANCRPYCPWRPRYKVPKLAGRDPPRRGYALRPPLKCRLAANAMGQPPADPDNTDDGAIDPSTWKTPDRDFDSLVHMDAKLLINATMEEMAAAGDWLDPNQKLVFYNFNGRRMLIAHWAGYSLIYHYPAYATFRQAEISVPANITIVTFATDNVLSQAMLLHQLDRAGIRYHNPAAGMTDWENTWKHPLLVELLPYITTEYTLILDSVDVLLCGPLDWLVPRFESYGKRVVFGSTIQPHPNMEIEHIPDRDSLGRWQNLNAGTVFGRTADLLPVYRRAIEVFNTRDLADDSWRSEQRVIRSVLAEDMDNIGFDHRCLLFQNFGKALICQQENLVTIS